MSKKPVTKTDQLLKCIAEHGPMYANQLADKTGLQTRNIDGHLVSSMRNGVIATRQGYVPERRRHMKHYMTQDQAAAWDARQQTPTADIPSEDQADPSPEASAAEGQGRKPLAEGVETVTVSLRVTAAQRKKLDRLGGAKWVRDRIDRAKEPNAALTGRPEAGPG